MLECVRSLNEAWTAGMLELLACESCAEVTYRIECLLEACDDPNLPEEFSVEELMDHCYVSIYVGVPFD
jgi:hypothetical protein